MSQCASCGSGLTTAGVCPKCGPARFMGGWRETTVSHAQYPFKCPVCEGRGQVSGGFYTGLGVQSVAASMPEKCRSCDGKGLVWAWK